MLFRDRGSHVRAVLYVVVVTTLTMWALWVSSETQSGAQQAVSLVNPSFEDGWHEQGAGELVIPNGWELEYRDGAHPWCAPPCKRPEVKPNWEHVVNGRYSVRSFTTFGRGLYGLEKNNGAVHYFLRNLIG